MAYEPTTWAAGDVVTSAKLNKLEQGVANGAFVIPVTAFDENDLITEVTTAQVTAAVEAGIDAYFMEVTYDGDPGVSMTLPLMMSSGRFISPAITSASATAVTLVYYMVMPGSTVNDACTVTRVSKEISTDGR